MTNNFVTAFDLHKALICRLVKKNKLSSSLALLKIIRLVSPSPSYIPCECIEKCLDALIKQALTGFLPDMVLSAAFRWLWKEQSNFEPSVLGNAAFLVFHLHTPVPSHSPTAE